MGCMDKTVNGNLWPQDIISPFGYINISYYINHIFYDSLNDEYEYALKWKIHDTLSRLGSLEDTFTQVYVYGLKEIYHYDI